MKKNDIAVIPDYYKKYVDQIPGNPSIVEALSSYGQPFVEEQIENYKALDDRIYAPGKWNVKQIFNHLNDSERIFAYRALRFARNDNQALPGYEQDDYAHSAQVAHRTLDEIIDEFNAIRESTICLYKSLTKNELSNVGTASGMNVSVLALGFIMVGHLIHHHTIIEQKYFPMIQ